MILYIRLRYSSDTRESVQECTLDGVRVRLRAMYNATSGRWYLDLQDITRAPIIGSIALVPGVDLLRPFRHLAIPQGRLYLDSAAAPDLSSLDSTVLLKYETVS